MSKPGLFIRRLGERLPRGGGWHRKDGKDGSWDAALFGWEFRVGDAVSEKVSQPGAYGFVDGSAAGGGTGINGGIGGGPGHARRVLFYVGVPSVEAALGTAESLGGARLMGPEPAAGEFAVGHFADPEGNVIGVAGPPR